MLITARVTTSLFWNRLSLDIFLSERAHMHPLWKYCLLVNITNIQIVVISPLLDGSTQPTKESSNQLIAIRWFMLTNQCAKRSPNADKTFYTCTYYTNKSLKFKTFHIFCKIFMFKMKNVRFMSRSSFCGSILSYEITENRIRVWQWGAKTIGWWLSTEHSILIVLLNFLFCLESRSKVLIFMNITNYQWALSMTIWTAIIWVYLRPLHHR